jgi:hypothetical protein
LDGGNVVDNYQQRAIVTKRLLADNADAVNSWVGTIGLYCAAMIKQVGEAFKQATGYTQLALVDDLGDTTGHADGMVAFLDDDVIGVTRTLTGMHARVRACRRTRQSQASCDRHLVRLYVLLICEVYPHQ